MKVCTIGLQYHPDDCEGQYVLAKTFLIKGEVVLAEKKLKKIVSSQPYHIKAVLLLVYMLEDLKKHKNTIAAHIKKIAPFYTNHKIIQQYYQKYCSSNKQTKIIKHTQPKRKNPFIKNPKLATITMYQLLYSQKRYEDAFSLLQVMKNNPKYKKFVQKEIAKNKKGFNIC